ncbi:deaminase domain-containing protein [Lysinibacillus sphaericus]|uniref:deaminase domain-containing protein n=1 Tax=Lysinibacillus sphaericus TaxID=1421 RepID=UPI001F38A438|nr:deaminase domain-containing protein [Lysinibacillus sphaericus]
MGLLGLAGSLLGMIPKVGSPSGKKKGKSGGSKGKSSKKSSKKKSSTKKKQKKSSKKKKKKKRKKKKKKWGKFFTKARKLYNKVSKSKIAKQFKKVVKSAVLATKKAYKQTVSKTKEVYKQTAAKTKEVYQQTKQIVKEVKQTTKEIAIKTKSTAKTVGKEIKNPVVKSFNSFKEIGKDFKDGLDTRKDKALNSPYDFANYLTLGAVDGIWSGAKSRKDKMFNSPSDFLNYATSGLTDMVKGSVNPKDPLSKEHWLDSFGVATSVLGVKGVSSTKPNGGSSYKPSNTIIDNNLQNGVNYGNRFPTKQINPVEDQHIIDKVAEARGQLSNKYKEKGNFAYAEVNISGIDKKDFYAHSGIHDASKKIPGAEEFSFKTENPIFKATEAPDRKGDIYLRDGDTEYKILNDLAERIGTNSKTNGTIKLFTEKDTCDSCNLIIQQFSKKYPDITIEVIHNSDKKILPKN